MVSGKGGVGKSTVTASLAVAMRRLGKKVGVLDADITGPSIPTAFGVHARAEGSELGIYPAVTKSGIEIMSLNLLMPNESDPVVWRGPIIAGAVKQFWTDVIWGDVDYLFVDMPPGTGDVPLTVFQSLPVDGIIVVTSPQELVGMIVTKAVKMAEMMQVPVLGLVENYSYYQPAPTAASATRCSGRAALKRRRRSGPGGAGPPAHRPRRGRGLRPGRGGGLPAQLPHGGGPEAGQPGPVRGNFTNRSQPVQNWFTGGR